MVFFQVAMAVMERAIYLINPIIKAKTEKELQERLIYKMTKLGIE